MERGHRKKRTLRFLLLLALAAPQVAEATGVVCTPPFLSKEPCSSGEVYYFEYTCVICGGIGKICNY
jgi:hypothetical protein